MTVVFGHLVCKCIFHEENISIDVKYILMVIGDDARFTINFNPINCDIIYKPNGCYIVELTWTLR